MKVEILESYGRRPAQIAVHQSPTKDHAAQMKKPTTPTKKGGLRSMMSKVERQKDAQAGLLQTSFTAQRPKDDESKNLPLEDLDPEFLAELPEEMRKEVIDEHRRRRLAQRSGLDAPARKSHFAANSLPAGQQKIRFPAPPPKISFANSGVTSTQELKDMLDAWHLETRDAGPHRGDVEVFEKYLVRVVREERDLEKVTKLVKWLDVIVVQDNTHKKGQKAWGQCLDDIKKAVHAAVEARGLAPLDI
jgi:DNA repair protein REV1